MENINLETFPSGNVLLLIEDAILVEKIKALLSLTPLSVVGQTQDIAEAWKLLVEAKPVLALLDESQISLAKAIKSFSSEISIMLVHSEGRETFEKTPYLDSVICESNLDSFFGELATLFEADNSLPKWVYIEALAQYHQYCQEVSLSARQKEILKQLTLGKSNSELAEHFYISVGTVRHHLHQIYTRLGVKDKPSAIVMALRGGIVN